MIPALDVGRHRVHLGAGHSSETTRPMIHGARHLVRQLEGKERSLRQGSQVGEEHPHLLLPPGETDWPECILDTPYQSDSAC